MNYLQMYIYIVDIVLKRSNECIDNIINRKKMCQIYSKLKNLMVCFICLKENDDLITHNHWI